MPVRDQILYLLRQRVEHAVLGPSRTDRVDGDPALGERHSEIAHQRFKSRFGRTHPDPRLKPARPAALGVSDRQDFAATLHQWNSLPNADQKCLRLRVERAVPLLEGDVHGGLKEGSSFRPRVAYEDVQFSKLIGDFPEHGLDLLGLQDVCLHDEPVASALSHFLQRVLGGGLVLHIVDCHLHAVLAELECDASSYSARSIFNEPATTHIYPLSYTSYSLTSPRPS